MDEQRLVTGDDVLEQGLVGLGHGGEPILIPEAERDSLQAERSGRCLDIQVQGETFIRL